jgi:undecaprenyl-diphosphatase
MDFAPDGLLAVLDRGELDAVAACVTFARRTRLTPAARFLSRLGNGWLYPIASALLLLASPSHALPYILAAGVSTGLAHLVYPPLKRLLARPRPCDLEPSLADDCQPLDRYSCPSGHAMTAAAFGVPIIVLAPAAAPIVIGGWLLVSWSRVALGHHYWSDIVIGSTIGGAIGAIVALLVA